MHKQCNLFLKISVIVIDSYNYLWVTGQKSNEVVCLKLSENNKKMLFKQAILLQGASCIVEIEGEKKEVW